MRKTKYMMIGCICLMLAATPVSAMNRSGEGIQIKEAFTDISKSDWYYDAAYYVSEKGLMAGISETEFAPNEVVTRGMLVSILYRLENEPEITAHTAFKDVEANQYYALAVQWAVENKIVSGYSKDTFNPEAPITREQIATMLYHYTQYKGIETPIEGMSIREYVDHQGVASWANYPMRWAIGAGGIISGKGEEKLMPQDKATRAEVATIIMRYCERQVEQ